MRRSPRFFSRDLTVRARLVYSAATLWFAFVSMALVWPLYVPFARVRPFVLGVPFSLAFLAGVLVASFAAGLVLYRWESRQGFLDRDADD
ncbi:MAG TPA: hypothetical protein QGG47_16505 [Acidobacteriota bacterium]|nr:hypothetical protein [Acidobacteriota bacterium]